MTGADESSERTSLGNDQYWFWNTTPSRRFPVYTRLNASDVLPEPVSPLGASMAWIPHILPGWATGYAALDAFRLDELAVESPPPVGGIFYGHLYINQSTVRVIGVRAGIGAAAIDAAFFAGDPDAPAHVARPEDDDDELAAGMAARNAWALTTTSIPELDEDRAIADGWRQRRPDLANLSDLALAAHARALMPVERLVWRGETIASNLSAVGPAVITQLIADIDSSLLLTLIGVAGDVDSAAPTYALWELSRAVRGDEKLSIEFDRGTSGLLDRLDAHPAFQEMFGQFLRDFGYRGPSEWDLASDSWETRPELALALVRQLRQLDEADSPAARQVRANAESAAAMQKVLAVLDGNPQAQETLKTAVACARRFGAWRERGKSNAVKVLHEARMALVELGRRLHARGELDDPRQIFMALEGELDILVLNPSALRETLRERQRRWDYLAGVELPRYVVAGEPLVPVEDLPRRQETSVAVASPGDVLTGAPASAGTARGRARIVLDTTQVGDLEPGEILVAPQTDPSWTPLFMISSAVVVGVGAMNSHAMIVSRELGIPCVASVTDATLRIPNGALVEVNGSTGTVTVLETPGT